MLEDRDIVLGVMQRIRKDPERFYIPLGTYDASSRIKKGLSNATGTLYNHVPIVKSIVESCRDAPVYVGYSGVNSQRAHAGYAANILSLHRGAQDEDRIFAQAYIHELVHLDQDRRGLRGPDMPPPPECLGDYVLHFHYLEAAAYATEVVSLMYLSHHSEVGQRVEEIAGYFAEYIQETGDSEILLQMADAQKGHKIKRFEDMRPAWQAAFQHFFHPDSAKLGAYKDSICDGHIQKIMALRDTDAKTEKYDWGSLDHLRAIATLPGWGPMFDEAVLPFIARYARAATLQDRQIEKINWTADHARLLAKKPSRGVPKITFG